MVAGTGAVSVTAENDLDSTALSGGLALGGDAGVGVSSSVIVSRGTVNSLLAGNVAVNAAGSFADQALSSQDLSVYSISAAAGDDAGIGGVATVVTSENDVEALVGAGALIDVADGVTLDAENALTTLSVGGGLGVSGSVGIGATASVVTVDDTTEALIEDGTSGDYTMVNAGGVRISLTSLMPLTR